MRVVPALAIARSLLLCWLGLAGTVAQVHAQAHALVQAPAGPAGERQRISGERAAVEARFKEQEAACQQRFAVTDCVNEAKKVRRNSLASLQRQGDMLDDAQRKQRAAWQRENISRKLEGAQAREREVVQRGSGAAASAPVASAAATSAQVASAAARADAASTPRSTRKEKPREPTRTSKAHKAPLRPSNAERSANEAGAQARGAARGQAAQDHREAVERRNAERAKRGKKVEPLPTPDG